MPKKETSPRMSLLATKWMRVKGDVLAQMIAECNSFEEVDAIAGEIRELAASVLSQDEHHG